MTYQRAINPIFNCRLSKIINFIIIAIVTDYVTLQFLIKQGGEYE